MTHAADIAIIVFLFILFSITHSLLASNRVKQNLVRTIGDRIAFYRLFYNFSSIISFAVFWQISPKPSVVIYDLQYPYDIAIFVLQILSLAGFFWASSFIDLREFFGIDQVLRFVKGTYDKIDVDEKTELTIKGPLKLCRHPIYLFSILFLAFRPAMDLFYTVFLICTTAYFIIGSYYEERKLVKKYGERYRKYQESVARILPKIY